MRPPKLKGGLETDVAYDDVPMQWTKDAKEAIRSVPAGFQRRRAKAKIEKSARKLGMTTITLEYAGADDQEAASEDYTPIFANKGTGTAPTATSRRDGNERPPNGSNGTAQMIRHRSRPIPGPRMPRARLDRAPEGFMRECTKALIEKHAEKIGTTVITLEVATEGIEQAKGTWPMR